MFLKLLQKKNNIREFEKNTIMNKLFFIKNPDLFQGEKYLNSNKNYFEGWYFKNTTNKDSIAFIPGININDVQRNAFVQIITNCSSYYITYDINEFKYNIEPFEIQIGKNYFSKERIHVDIEDNKQKVKVYGDIKYSNCKNINTSILNPNIMGPFAYVPFMECNHAILSMKNEINGLLNFNDTKISFNNDIGYIEKDWGYSFPKSYIWCQGNRFQNANASFMISIADIPFKFLSFTGIICDLIIDDKEFRFATYNNTKLIKCNIDNNLLDISLKKDNYKLNIKSSYNTGLRLSAPVKGKMEKDVFENIDSIITIVLEKNNETIFGDTSTKCGIEIVK